MAKVNMAAVKVLVAEDKTGRMKAAATQRANEVFEDAVIGMQVEFEDHPVTREIAGGIYADNISKTLGGGKAPRSLFSFIGFKAGSDPLEPIRDALNPHSKIGKTAGPKLSYRRKDRKDGNARFIFEVAEPDRAKIYKATPMPWASGWSWAQKIETRIPNFSHFLARWMPNAPEEVSRSKGGTQLAQEIRPGAHYQPPQGGYLSGIFASFLDRVRQYGKGGLKRRFDIRPGAPSA